MPSRSSWCWSRAILFWKRRNSEQSRLEVDIDHHEIVVRYAWTKERVARGDHARRSRDRAHAAHRNPVELGAKVRRNRAMEGEGRFARDVGFVRGEPMRFDSLEQRLVRLGRAEALRRQQHPDGSLQYQPSAREFHRGGVEITAENRRAIARKLLEVSRHLAFALGRTAAAVKMQH